MTKVCGASPSSQKNCFTQRPLTQVCTLRPSTAFPVRNDPRCFVGVPFVRCRFSTKWWPTATHRVHQEKAEVQTLFGSHGDVTDLCGIIMRGNATFREMNLDKTNDQHRNRIVPDSFAVRTAWPQCAPLSGHIRSEFLRLCWAFGSTEAFNDRRCVATGDTTLMSVEDTTPNCGFFSMGLQRRPARAGLALVQEHWRRRLRRPHGHRHRNDLWAALAGTLRSSCGGICRIPRMLQFRVLHSFALYLQ